MRKYFFLFFIFFIFINFLEAFFISFKTKNPYYSDNIQKAIKYYEKKLQNEPNNILNYYNLASIYKEFGYNKRAFDMYREITFINEKEIRAHFELAKMYYFLGALSYAEEEIKKLVRINAVNWEIYYWWGCILFEMKKYSDAIDKFKKSIKLDNNKILPYLKLAEIYKKQKKFNKAISYYKQGLAQDKTYTEINKKIALLYEKKKNYLKAYTYWQKTSDIDSKDKKALNKVWKYREFFPLIKEKIKKFKKEKSKKRKKYIPPRVLSLYSDNKNIPVIKIGIIRKAKFIYFKSGSNFEVYNKKNKLLFKGKKNKEYYVFVSKNKKKCYFGESISKKQIEFKDEIYIKKDDKNTAINVYNVKYGEGFYWSEKKDMNYRGDFIVKFNKPFLTFINLINVEEYLYGVVPAEIPPSWPYEALKAQVVAARTYTLKNLGKHKREGFDLCATQHCAVYKGVSGEHPRTNKAVDETFGEVLYSKNGKLLDTFYFHSCGGHTQNVYDVWGVKRINELNGVYDGNKNNKWHFPLEPFWLEEWVRTFPDVYCKIKGPGEVSFRWIRYLNGFDLTYFINRIYKIGKVKSIYPIKRAKSGAIVKVKIIGEKGEKTVKFDTIRNVLGKIRSNVIKWEYRKDKNGFIKDIYIYGAGWGHGVGMCQRGAQGMAKKNKNYKEILYHYYPGSYIKRKY